MTSRDPARRAAEITAVSGLIAPCRVAYCCRVEDRRAVETAVKAALGGKRVRGRRELFRCDVDTARRAIEAAACRSRPVPLPRRARHARWRSRRWRNKRLFAVLALSAMLLAVILACWGRAMDRIG
jgi:IS5 family transposase